MITVHKQRLCEASSPVQDIHDECKVRKPCHDHVVDIPLSARLYDHKQHHTTSEECANISDSQGGFPEDLPVPFDKQVVEILKALLLAGDGCVGGDFLLFRRLNRRSGFIHLARDRDKQFLIHLPVEAEGHHSPKAQKAGWNPDQEQRCRSPERQDKSHGGRHIGKRQQERRQQPGYLLQVVLVTDIAVLLIVPQGVGSYRDLHTDHTERDQQTQPQRGAAVQAEQYSDG